MIIAGVRVDEEINFDEIDKKVKYINENKKYCEETIRELNTLIDLDYIKASEFIEGNTLQEISQIDFDENTKVMRASPPFINELPKERAARKEYLKNLRYDSDKNSLIIMKRGKDTSLASDYKVYVCELPKHLSALERALSKARHDRNLYQSGEKLPYLTRKFIEEINAKFFEKTEFNGETGYGSYRRIYYKNGEWVLPDVYIKDTKIKVSRCENVPDDMEELIKFYNTSDLHPVLKAIIFKVKMIKIHPFCDGNGRTSRILLNYMFVRYGYPTITIAGKEKFEYFNALEKALTNNNYTDIIKIIMKHMNERCDKYIQVINEQKTLNEEVEQEI